MKKGRDWRDNMGPDAYRALGRVMNKLEKDEEADRYFRVARMLGWTPSALKKCV